MAIYYFCTDAHRHNRFKKKLKQQVLKLWINANVNKRLLWSLMPTYILVFHDLSN